MRRIFLALITVLAFAFGCGKESRPSFVLISLDATRADHMGLYGYARNTTPRLDALAREGLVFDQAISSSNTTLNSHASIFTGLFTAAHGATPVGEGTILSAAYQTVAEDFRDAGYETAGFAAHRDWLCARFGMDQGFQVYTTDYRRADAVLEDARAWLSKRDPDKPFFLFIHVYDVHSRFEHRPYAAPDPFQHAFVRDYRGDLEPWENQPVAGSEFLLAVHEGHIEITPEDLRYLTDSYDEGLAYTDDRVGRFLESLKAPENTYIVVTADHGEELQDHGGMLHCSWYDEITRVPLVFVPPSSERDRFRAPRRIRDQVRLVDLRPTLLSLAGLSPAGACQGTNLLSWLEDPAATCPAGPAVLQDARALRFGGYKVIQGEDGPELFDLNADPGEKTNLAFQEDEFPVISRMSTFLLEQQKKDAAIRETHIEAGGRQLPDRDPEAEERLRALGYTR